MIFATSTNVQEEKYKEPFVRFNSDIIAYNNAAVEVLKGTGTEINDLYAVTETIPDSGRSDLTHFNTPDGVKIVGGAVVSVLCGATGIDEKTLCDVENAPDKIDKKVLGA